MSRHILVTERALLQTRLPNTTYEKSTKYYCFQCGSRTPPRSVRHWHSFVEDVRRYEVSDYSIFAPLNLRNDTVQIFDEGNLLCLMDTTVLTIIRSIWDHRSVSFFRIKACSRVDWHITDDDGRAIVCISLKPCWALRTNNDVDAVQEYERGENDFHDYVNNMYDYMLNLGIRYGILTTYDNTWFMRRSFEDESVLEISQCHNIETDHLLLLSWNYIIHLGNVSRPCHPNPDYDYDSYNNENNPPGPTNNRYLPRSVSDNSDYNSNEQGLSSSGEQSSDGDVNYSAGGQSQYSKFELHKPTLIWSDIIWKSYLNHWAKNGPIKLIEYHGQLMVLKITPIGDEAKYKSLISEVEIYEHLRPLQGKCIPRLFHYGYALEDQFYVLALEYLHPEEKVPTRAYSEQAMNIIADIHDHDVLHNDVSLTNYIVSLNKVTGTRQLYMIDFDSSKLCGKDDNSLWEEKKMNEKQKVLDLFDGLS